MFKVLSGGVFFKLGLRVGMNDDWEEWDRNLMGKMVWMVEWIGGGCRVEELWW